MRMAASSLIAGIWRPVRYEHSAALSGCWPFEFLTVRSQPAKSKKLWRSCFWVLRNQSCLYLYTSVIICLFMHFLCAGGLHTSRTVYVVQAHSPVAFGRPVNFRLSYRWISSQFWAYHPSKLCRGRFRRRSDD